MKLKKMHIATIFFALMAAVCFASYHLIGVSVAPDGYLKESFGFIPLTYLFATLTLICGVVPLLRKLNHNF